MSEVSKMSSVFRMSAWSKGENGGVSKEREWWWCGVRAGIPQSLLCIVGTVRRQTNAAEPEPPVLASSMCSKSELLQTSFRVGVAVRTCLAVPVPASARREER